MKVALADFGVGNLFSLSRGLEVAGAHVGRVTRPRELLRARCVVLPGVASFPAMAAGMAGTRTSLRQRLESGVPALGVCLGLQILFERSEEGPGDGLGLLPGTVRRLKSETLPHMGWNTAQWRQDRLFEGVPREARFYFAHTYAGPGAREVTVARTRYGETFSSAVRKGNTYGVQFHPEKSGPAGLRVLRNFVAFAEEAA